MDIQSAQPTPHSPVVTLYLTLKPKLTDTLRRLSGIFFFRQGGYIFIHVRLLICPFVSQPDYSNTTIKSS